MRRLAGLLAVVLLLAGCSHQSGPGTPEPRPTGPRTDSPAPTGPSGSTSATAAPDRERCRGVTAAQVRGTPPAYPPHRLRRWSADGAVCAAYWIARTAADFVPQSLAIDGDTAYVGGYLHRPRYTDQACQIVVLDLRTGRETRFQSRFEAPVYRPAPTFCRHGGGMQLTEDGLWVQETERLWLLDPARIGRGDPVKRVWRMEKGLRGSTTIVSGSRLGVGSFSIRRPGVVVWFRVADLLRPGVTELTRSAAADDQATARTDRRTLPLVQGIANGAGGLWFSVSGGECAALVGPDGVRHGWVPGGEGLQFAGRDVWVLSESGAKHVVRGRATTVPALLRLRTARVLGTRPAC